MKTYFQIKLKDIVDSIERCKNNIIKYAQELDIKYIIEYTTQLRSLQLKHEEFTKDVVMHLPVIEIIELLQAKLLNENKVAYAYKYDHKGVTLAEREILSRISYQFKDIKVK